MPTYSLHSPGRKRSKGHGVVLVFAAGILAILAALGTSMFALSHSSSQASIRYTDMVRADLLSRAGVSEAIIRLRNQTYIKTEDPSDAWFTVDYLRGAKGKISFPYGDGKDNEKAPLLPDGIIDNEDEPKQPYSRSLGSTAGESSDRFTLEVSDAASKININAGDNLAVILDNLCRVIGPPLVAANLDALQPRRWAQEADPGDPDRKFFDTAENKNDTVLNKDIYYELDADRRPKLAPDGTALYGDGYAIAGHRARHGAFRNLDEVKKALTFVDRNANGIPDDPLERLEIEMKFAALRDHITVGSWVDTNTVCVGKFEWVHLDYVNGKTFAMDRDKSWVIDDPVNDPLNHRGSLRGCYLSIMNGHGAGQLRRIRTNGIDWVEVEGGFAVTPGPISSYMIIAPEDAMLMDVDGKPLSYSYPDKMPPEGKLTLPQTKADGSLVDNPKIDYTRHPLCIHRAPVNVNTATDKVLAALFLGINIQHGHPMALGTETEVPKLRKKWKKDDPHKVQPYLLRPAGLKRIPASSGKPILTKSWGGGTGDVLPPPAFYDAAYINNHNTVDVPGNWVSSGKGLMNDAHELAYRIIMARQSDKDKPTFKFVDPFTGSPTDQKMDGYGRLHPRRGPFRNYDDLYFRVIKPWDEKRFDEGAGLHARLSPMVMANCNSNTDILKFNPNIEWIDRWSRNYTDREPVMIYTNRPYPPGGIFTSDVPAATEITASSVPIYTSVRDSKAKGWKNTKVPPLHSSQKDKNGNYIKGAYITRTFRYKSDELIDKTDLNRSTTEFSFDSNGVFYVVSTGQVLQKATGQLFAERKMEALIKVYDVWRESTQQQFVMGTISKAFGDRRLSRNKTHMSCTGQLARDASGLVEPKGLVTLPEPLVPLKTRIVDVDGNPNPRNHEAVSGILSKNHKPLDAFGNVRKNPYDKNASAIAVPEVLANRILPARWDGQIVLSTNSSSFDPSLTGDTDSFLASFDGDTDTATCLGNGREQAKWPYSAVPDGKGGFMYTGEGYKYRCVQSIGLLGVLFDTMIATDPGIPLYDGKTPFNDWTTGKDKIRWVYPFYGVSSALMPLSLGANPDRPAYWNTIKVRMGSLRTDGAYLTASGVSGNTATLKYPLTPGKTKSPCSPKGNPRYTKLNWQVDSVHGNLLTMWIKPAWHHDDMGCHEFVNVGNEGQINKCEMALFVKTGQYKWCSAHAHKSLGQCGSRKELNDLSGWLTYKNDSGYCTNLHGGFQGIKDSGGYGGGGGGASPESPGYRVQPFRWSYLGWRTQYRTNHKTGDSIGPRGHMANPQDWKSPSCQNTIRHFNRPFIDTALFPEGPDNWPSAKNGGKAEKLFWIYRGSSGWQTKPSKTPECRVGHSRDLVGGGSSVTNPNPTAGGRWAEGQDAKWAWAEPYGKIAADPDKPDYSMKIFGINNLNYGNPQYNKKFNPAGGGGTCSLRWHFRQMPEDGTYAVIDEFKISNRDRVLIDTYNPDWKNDRALREMMTSRYYLPPFPDERKDPTQGGPPTFTSQTLLQSLKGYGTTPINERIAVVRVGWNAFTPRFMCEYQKPSTTRFKRTEWLTNFNTIDGKRKPITVPFKGPFDYVRYNDPNDLGLDSNPLGTAFSVNRPAPHNYPIDVTHPDKRGLAQASKGVEVELLKDTGSGALSILENKTFTVPTGTFPNIDPNGPAVNSLGSIQSPVWCLPSELRYRVRFRYPVDPLVDRFCMTRDRDNDRRNWPCVDPNKHYLLDTPVFDDISITYILPVRILDYREVTE